MKKLAMNKSVLGRFSVSILLGCITLIAFAAVQSTQAQTTATTAISTDSPALPISIPLHWKSSGVMVKPVSDANHSIVSVKDPTVVNYNGLWHICATAYSISATEKCFAKDMMRK
jgi:hypothetical protein